MVKRLIAKAIRAGKASKKQAAENSAKFAKEKAATKKKPPRGAYNPPQKLASPKKKSTSSDGSKIQKAMGAYKKDFLMKLQKEHGKKEGMRLFKEMDEMGYFKKGGVVKRK
jgi:hypothetical protein